MTSTPHPRAGERRQRRAQRVSTGLALALAAVMAAPAAVDAAEGPLTRRATAPAPQIAPPPPEVVAVTPPQPGGDPMSFAGRAGSITTGLEAALELAADEGQRDVLRRAQASVQAAGDEWNNGETDTTVAMAHLVAAVQQLDTREGTFDHLSRPIADLTRHIARSMLDVAVHGGIDPASKRAVEADLALADDAYDGGDDPGCAEHSEDALLKLAPKLEFDLPTFVSEVETTFGPNSIGFSYAVFRDGSFAAGNAAGQARTTADSPSWSQSRLKEMNVASISKTITTTALMRLLAEKGILVTSPVAPYLPPTWTRGPGIGGPNGLTFQDLLTQRSGLDQFLGDTSSDRVAAPLTYQGLKSVYEAGVTKPKAYEYQNSNFAIFRLIIPRINGDLDWIDEMPGFVTDSQRESMEAATSITSYQQYVNLMLVAEANVSGACRSTDQTPRTLNYMFPDLPPPLAPRPGTDAGNWSSVCGGGGWYFTATELAQFASQLRNGTMLPPASRAATLLRHLGYMDPADYSWGSGAHGTYHNHGGDLWWRNSNSWSPSAPMRGIDTCLMSYPNNVQVALLVNSQGPAYPGGPYQCAALHTAYDSSWVWVG